MDKQEICLIKPRWRYPITAVESTYNRVWPPLSLLNCAALLRKEGFPARVIDAHAERLSPEETAALAKGAGKVFVSSGCLDRWQCPNSDITPFMDTVREAMKVSGEVYAMGYHGTVFPEIILNKTGVKAVILGEPEGAVLELAGGSGFSSVKGIAYLKDGKPILNGEREPLDLNSLPVPAFDLVDTKKYFYELLGNDFALFETSRGCPCSCSFCSKAMTGGGPRRKNLERVFAEIEFAVFGCGAKSAYFFDLDFGLDREYSERICDYLIEKRIGLRWCCQTCVSGFDERLLLKMKKAGCRLVHCGIESGSDRVLKSIRKNISREETKKYIKSIKKCGMEVLCFFMFGFPGETEREMRETTSFALELNCDYASFHIATPYPGTGIPGDAQGCSGGLSMEDCFPVNNFRTLKKTVRGALLKFYGRPAYLLGRLLHARPALLLLQLRLFFGYFR
jgi:anaerobic magnesium-protoporphyrin IX monomethyl ester cyclase